MKKKLFKLKGSFDSIKKARWAQKYIGKNFQSTVSSIIPLGIFTFIPEYDLHGLISREDLKRYGFYLDKTRSKFFHNRNASSYSLGNSIEIKIKSADIEMGKIEFALIETGIVKFKNKNFSQDKR